MIEAFFLSLGQLLDPRIARVFLKSIALTVVLFAAAGVGLWYSMHALEGRTAEWMGAPPSGWVADILTILIFFTAWWLLFRAIAIAVIGIFGDEVVAAVEVKHYPAAHAQARDVPLGRSVAMGVGSAARLIAVNLLLSPVYIMLLVTGLGTAVAFFLANAWLLGRDLGDMVAARHLPYRDLPDWRRRTGLRRFVLGSVGTGLFLVPLVNLIAPVLSAAMATHAFHRGRRV